MRFHRTATDRLRRSIALIGAAVLLLGQLAAVAHTHAPSADKRAGAVGELSAGDILCPLCLLVFHSTPEPSAPPAIHRPQVCPGTVADLAAVFVESPVLARAMTRAPPAALS